MKLFDDKKRTDSKYANHLDNIYDFYDRSCLNQSGLANLIETKS